MRLIDETGTDLYPSAKAMVREYLGSGGCFFFLLFHDGKEDVLALWRSRKTYADVRRLLLQKAAHWVWLDAGKLRGWAPDFVLSRGERRGFGTGEANMETLTHRETFFDRLCSAFASPAPKEDQKSAG